MEALTYLSIGAAILMAFGTILLALSHLAHARNNETLADELDAAHEALDVAGKIGARVATGTPLPSAIAAEAPSDEAQDLLRRFKTFAHLALVLVALTFLGGCISKGEYVAFVKASRAFYDGAAPIVTNSVNADPNLSDQSKKNRTGFVDDYRVALEAAENRSSGK